MKKILINITNGISLRYLCHSDILKTLLKKNIQIYILSANSNSTKKNLKIADINYVEFDKIELTKFKYSSKIYSILDIIRFFSNGGHYRTPQIIFDYYKLSLSKFFIISLFKNLLNQFRFLRKFLIYLQSFYYPKSLYKKILNIKPDLIITSSLGVFSFDEYVIRIAKKLKIKSCSCILSWDNTTTRGYPGAVPDNIFAWTEVMKKELIEFSDCSSKKIIVAGVPQFDHYFNKKKVSIIKNFFINKKKLTNKKKILFITKGPSTFQYNPNIAKVICENIKNRKIKNSHLIVRIHPLFYKIGDSGELEFQNAIDAFKKLENEYDCLTVNYPIVSSLKQDFEISGTEQQFLKNLITHSDIIVNVYSTLNIEGAIFNKPLINIDYDNFNSLYDWNKKFERQDLAIDRSLDHNIRIMSYNAISSVRNEKELINKINLYLVNPFYKSKERKKLVENEVGPYRGMSGNFIAKKLLTFL
jgi:hypothetical protein